MKTTPQTAPKQNPATAKVTAFQTPHERAKSAKDKTPAKSKPVGRDAFGGRIGTRMSDINVVVINAGKRGATVNEVAKKISEAASIVSAQLSWMAVHKEVATRKEEKAADGTKGFRYFAKPIKKQNQ